MRKTLVALVVIMCLSVLIAGSSSRLLTLRRANAQDQCGTTCPQIHDITVNVNQSQSKTILIQVDNLDSPLNWTDLQLTYTNDERGITITLNPLLQVAGVIPAHSENFTLEVGISVAKNVSAGSYTIPFTLTVQSSFISPTNSTSLLFDVTIEVMSQSAALPPSLIYFYLTIIFIAAVGITGTVYVCVRSWRNL